MNRNSCVFVPRTAFTAPELNDPAAMAREDALQGNHMHCPSVPPAVPRFTNATETRFSAVYTPHSSYTDAEIAELVAQMPHEAHPARRFAQVFVVGTSR